jgi:glycosyltransferase involved in cell wall biosynthesis
MARQSDHLVVHGEALRELAAARFGKPIDRVHVLHHPAITRYLRLAEDRGLTAAPPGDGLRLLMFGRIFAYKGLTTLLRAESLLPGGPGEPRITIAGRGDDPMERRDLMRDPGRYDIRHRFIEDAEVAQLFLDTDVVVLPYTEASQSGVLLLAASFGKPVIVTDVGELRATVEPAGIGLVVPPDDPPALAAAIARLSAQPALRQQMAARARHWAATEVTPETVGAAAAAIYRQAIGGRS